MEAIVVSDSTTTGTIGTNIAAGDEEAQQTLSTTTVDTLQKQVRQTEHFMQNANGNIKNLQCVTRDLQDKMLEFQTELDTLKKKSSIPASQDDKLPEDVFTLMMISSCIQARLLVAFTFAFQMVLILMILFDQLQSSNESSAFNVPFKVKLVVRVGQGFTIIFALATQIDVITSIRFLVMFWKSTHWDKFKVVLDRSDEEDSADDEVSAHTKKWIIHMLIPNVLKFLQGIIVLIITMIVIVQSDNIIKLLTGFTAMMKLSDADNVFFSVAANGFLGLNLQRQCIKAKGIKVDYESTTSTGTSNSNQNTNQATSSKGFLLRSVLLVFILLFMIGFWVYIFFNQVNGIYFQQRYENCIAPTVDKAFKLATEHFGDGKCYGGPLNTLACEFEGGDCINFNTAFPLCKGEARTDVSNLIGDGNCDEKLMHPDCDFDGGDCCPYDIINSPSFGDGTCDKEMNTEGCFFDNGDCAEYNRDLPECPFDIVHNSSSSFGDGQCNGGMSSTLWCKYDDGDCNQLHIEHPNCPLEDLSNMTGADDAILGNGICDNGIYTIKECGFNFGDCYQGQIGQSIVIPDDVRLRNSIYFSKVFSLDGSTVAVGLYRTDKHGRIEMETPGVVKVWRFDDDRKLWLQLGKTIASTSGLTIDFFGERMSMSVSGNHLAIPSNSGLRVFEFSNLSGNEEWSQLGQTLESTFLYSYGIISSDGSRVALVSAHYEIRIYNLRSNLDGQTWIHDDDLDVIEVDDFSTPSDPQEVQLRFSSRDGSILLFTDFYSNFLKVFQQTSPDVAWAKMGQDIEMAPSSSMAISSNGNRIALHTLSTNTSNTSNSGQDEVQVLDYNGSEWLPVGSPIINSESTLEDQKFGYSIDMSADGNILMIGLNHPYCGGSDLFNIDECTKSSRASYKLYTYFPSENEFVSTPLRENVEDTNSLISDGNILYGLYFSMSNGDNDSTLLSVSNYNLDNEEVFIDVIDLDELYYTKCAVNNPSAIGDENCNTDYNTTACGFDGGDCTLKPVEGYPDCFVLHPFYIIDGYCRDEAPYNTSACGFDDGDCIPKPVNGYPDCLLLSENHQWIGDVSCDDEYPYNTSACGFDGGDCIPKPVNGYPDCLLLPQDHQWIYDDNCDDEYPYSTEACGFDGGVCDRNPVNGYPDCFVHNTTLIDNGYCNDFPPYNTTECGFDGGDCL